MLFNNSEHNMREFSNKKVVKIKKQAQEINKNEKEDNIENQVEDKNQNENEEDSHLKKYIKEINQHFLSFEAEKYPNSLRFGDHYSFEGILGKGAFGQVISAIQKQDNKRVAIKIIEKKNFKKIDSLDKEAKILQHLDHPNIIKFLAAHESSKSLIIVMEYFDGVSLDQFIKKRANQPFNNNEVREIIKQILLAIHHMHSSEVLHRDLKPENILIKENDGQFQIRIIDFGLSFKNEQIGTVSDNCGTLIYMAPEVAFNRQYQRSVDLWSCGIIQYMLFTMGKHPLYVKSDDRKKFLQKLKNPQWEFPENMNKEARQFFLKTAAPIAEDRMSAFQCTKHVWISGEGHISDPVTMNDMILCFSKSQSFSRILKAMVITQYIKSLSKKQCLVTSSQIEVKNPNSSLLSKQSIQQYYIGSGREKSESIETKYLADEVSTSNQQSTNTIKSQKSIKFVQSPQEKSSKIRRNCTFDDELQLQWTGKTTSKSLFNYQSMVLREQTSQNKKDNDSIYEETQNKKNLNSSDDSQEYQLNQKSVSSDDNSNLSPENKKTGGKFIFNHGNNQEHENDKKTSSKVLSRANLTQLTIVKQNSKNEGKFENSPLNNSQISRNSELGSNCSPYALKKSNLYHIRKVTQKKSDTPMSSQGMINSQQAYPCDNMLTSVGEFIDSPIGQSSCSIKNIFNKPNSIKTSQVIDDTKLHRINSQKIQNPNRRNSKSSVNLQAVKSIISSPRNHIKNQEMSQNKKEVCFSPQTKQIQNSFSDLQQNCNDYQTLSKMNTLKEQIEENLTTERSVSEFQASTATKQQKEQISSQYYNVKNIGGNEYLQTSIIAKNQSRITSVKQSESFDLNNNLNQQNINYNNHISNGNINNNKNINYTSSVTKKTQKIIQTFLSPRFSCPVNKMTSMQLQSTLQQQSQQLNTTQQQNGLFKNPNSVYFNTKSKDQTFDINRKQRVHMKSLSQVKDIKSQSLQNSPQISHKTQIGREYLNFEEQNSKFFDYLPSHQLNSNKADNSFKKRSSEQMNVAEYFKFNFDTSDQILFQGSSNNSSPQVKAMKTSQLSINSSSPQESSFKLPPINNSGNGNVVMRGYSNSLQGQLDSGHENSPITTSNLSINSFNSDQLPNQVSKANCSSSQSLKIYDKLGNNNNSNNCQSHNQQHLKSQFYNNNSTTQNSNISNNINYSQITNMMNNNTPLNNNNINNNNNTIKKQLIQQQMQIK